VILLKNYDISETMKLFYYSTQIPVFLVKDNKVTSALPSFPSMAESMIKHAPDPIFFYEHRQNKIQYVTTSFKEQLLVCLLSNGSVVAAGPFLLEPITGKEMVEILKAEKVSIKQKAILDDYYSHMKQITSQTYYYSGQLMEVLFCVSCSGTDSFSHSEDRISGIDTFFKNVYKDREKMFAHPPFFLEKKVSNFICSGNLSGALETLKEINRLERAILSDNPLRSLKNSVICSCTFIARASIDAGISPDIAFSYSDAFIQQIEKLQSLEEVGQFEATILTNYIELVKNYLDEKYSHIVVNVMQYIDENLTIRLSLKDISMHVHVNPHYLSTLFKKETGQTITDYIAEHRVRESSYFVAYTDYEISDIANLYQFCNQSYYITIFKKHLSKTPSEYRMEKH
jgi:two-component system response regulator YesN